MPNATMQSVPSFAVDAMNAAQVGTWDYDVAAGTMCGDANMARLFGHSASEAEAGLPFDTFCRHVDREDNARAEVLRAGLRERGGVLLFEVRVSPTPGLQRWLMIRGAFERDEASGMRGRGIAIDVTGSRLDGSIRGEPMIVADVNEDPSQLDAVARHAIATRNAVDDLAEPERSDVRPPADSLLLAIGRAIARRIGMAKA